MIWFDKNRGKVNAISSVAVSFGFSSSPLLINHLIEGYSWEGAWKILALVLFVMSFLIFQLYKNRPEEYGLLPDGTKKLGETDIGSLITGKQFTLKEAKGTRAFWMYGLVLAFNSFFITGLTFHVVSIFASEGYPKSDAISIFLPGSVIAVTISTIFNFLSDYIKLKWYLYLMILGGITASIGFLFLDTPFGIPLLIAGFGTMGGFFAVLNAIVWPRFYGRNNLGAITGKVMGFLILGSALAPPIFSLFFSTFGSYELLGYLGLAFLLFLVAGSVKANNPQLEN